MRILFTAYSAVSAAILGCAPYFIHRLPWEKKNRQQRILCGVIGAFEGRNCEKTTLNEEEKSALSLKQCIVSQDVRNNNKIARIALRISSPSTVFSGSGSQRLLPARRPKSNAPGKEIWLEWRSDCRNWSLFWGQRQIVPQKRHRNIREALEWMYHSWRRLYWWMKPNFA